MDEITDNGTNIFGNSKEATTQAGRLVFETIFNEADTRNSGKLFVGILEWAELRSNPIKTSSWFLIIINSRYSFQLIVGYIKTKEKKMGQFSFKINFNFTLCNNLLASPGN